MLIIQIDGLSAPLLNWMVLAGNLPNLGGWIRDGSHSMVDWHTGVPATTPASQAGHPARRLAAHPGVPVVREGDRPGDGHQPRPGRGRDRGPDVDRARPARRRRRQHQQQLVRRRGQVRAGVQPGRPAEQPQPWVRPVLLQPAGCRARAGAVRRRDGQGAAPGPPAARPAPGAAGQPRRRRTSSCARSPTCCSAT